jgi:carboxyl-terminal processing protease
MKIFLVLCVWLAGAGLGFGQGMSFGPAQEMEVFGGIGAVLNKDNVAQTIYVAGVLPGLAAAKAGLMQNDIIAEVDGVSVYGKDLPDVVELIRGPVGSTVEISIVRDPSQPALRLTIVREGVQAPK